jgi:MYXO-CTERM domain-containing protein
MRSSKRERRSRQVVHYSSLVVAASFAVLVAGCPGDPTAMPPPEIPPADNGYLCKCTCHLGAFSQSQDLNVCFPAALNPHTGGATPTPTDLVNDCSGRVKDAANALGKVTKSCDVSCECAVGDTTFSNAACDAPCDAVPLPSAGASDAEIKAATVVPASLGAACGLTSDTTPVCRINDADPPVPTPLGIVSLGFAHGSVGRVNSGNGHVTIGDNMTDTPIHGTVGIIGGPCPGTSCAVGMNFFLTADEIDASAFLGLASATISNIEVVGATLPAALILDAAGNASLPAGAIQADARGTKKEFVLGVEVSSETHVFEVTNSGPISLHIDWAGHTFTFSDEFTVPATPAIVIAVTFSGTIDNEPPTADASATSAVVECTSPSGAAVTLDGSASVDPENNIGLYTWRQGSSLANPPVATGQVATVPQPLDSTQTYVLAVFDGFGQTDRDTISVGVVDTTPPEFDSVSTTRDCLWPPNHKYVRLDLGKEILATATDTCDATTTIRITGVTSDEPDNGLGDGNTHGDIVFGETGVCLRAERAGSGDGRTYTITLTATDASGNSSNRQIQVVVPHDSDAGSCSLPPDAFIDARDVNADCQFSPAVPSGRSSLSSTAERSATGPSGGCSTGGDGATWLVGAAILLLVISRSRRAGLLLVAAACGSSASAPAPLMALSGGSMAGYVDGAGPDARFNLPMAVAVDAQGVAYIADRENNRIRRIALDGSTTTLVGGAIGLMDGAPATARLGGPNGLALDGDGLVFSEYSNNAIRRVELSTGRVTTIAGGPDAGMVDGALAQARFQHPFQLAVDSRTGAIFVADAWNNAVRRIDRTTGQVTTVGTGLFHPFGVALDGAGTLYVADTEHDAVIHMTADGATSVLVGRDQHGKSPLAAPSGLAVAADGTLLIADRGNDVIQALAPGAAPHVIAGVLHSDSGQNALRAPTAVAIGPSGLYVTDQHRIRLLAP